MGSAGPKMSRPNNQNITDESLNSILTIKQSVLNQTFKWGDAQQVCTAKTGGLQNLDILNVRDRLVQEVLR